MNERNELPRISVRVPEEDIAWLQTHYGSTTQGIRMAIQMLRGTVSLASILQARFHEGGTITVGALLVRVPLSYHHLFAILNSAKQNGAIVMRMNKARSDEDLANFEISEGRHFERWLQESSPSL